MIVSSGERRQRLVRQVNGDNDWFVRRRRSPVLLSLADEHEGMNDDRPGRSEESSSAKKDEFVLPLDQETAAEDDETDDARSTTDEPRPRKPSEADETSRVGDVSQKPDDNREELARPEIEPGDPELENVIFVVLGVLLMLFVIYRIASIFGG